jgi:hypothetical protein
MSMSTYDLFISYSSFDRPWAEKIYEDLRLNFTSIGVFWDRVGISTGAKWRSVLTDAVVNTTHLLILWSDAAKASKEVQPEIATFEAEVRRTPKLGTSERREFYISLQGAPGGGLEGIQGFPGLSPSYDPNTTDRGVGTVDTQSAHSEWKRAIRMIGDAILQADAAEPVIAGIVVTNTSRLPLLDQLHDLAQNPTGPSLDEFLAPYQLTWNNVRSRYGANALYWRPFGGSDTIVDLLEDLRVQVNSRLDPSYWFRWEYMDLGDKAFFNRRKELNQRPALLVVDPISLFDTYTANVFRALEDYLRVEHSLMASLAPVGQPGVDWFAQAIRAQAVPLLDEYFEPKIPPLSGFAKCILNVQRISEIERLIRGRIGTFHVAQKEAEARHTTGIGKK